MGLTRGGEGALHPEIEVLRLQVGCGRGELQARHDAIGEQLPGGCLWQLGEMLHQLTSLFRSQPAEVARFEV